jgi:hypothetical protein
MEHVPSERTAYRKMSNLAHFVALLLNPVCVCRLSVDWRYVDERFALNPFLCWCL